MLWRWIVRFDKDEEGNAVRSARDAYDHWREVALDQGFDPERNVTYEENDLLVSVGISEEMDMEFREAPGTWR